MVCAREDYPVELCEAVASYYEMSDRLINLTRLVLLDTLQDNGRPSIRSTLDSFPPTEALAASTMLRTDSAATALLTTIMRLYASPFLKSTCRYIITRVRKLPNALEVRGRTCQGRELILLRLTLPCVVKRTFKRTQTFLWS